MCTGFSLKKTPTVSLSIDVRITMISGVVYVLRIFKMFHGLMNNPVLYKNQWRDGTHILNTENGISANRFLYFTVSTAFVCKSQWPCGLKRRPTAARLLRLWVRIPPRGMDICCDCCVLSGRGLCDGLIIRQKESYRLRPVVVCYQETSNTRRLKPATGLWKYNHDGLWRQENKRTAFVEMRLNIMF